MIYMGSKRLIAKHILPIILKDRQPNQYYVEPFVGGCNTIMRVTGNRLGNDNNKYLISLYNAIITGWVPPSSITVDEYNQIRDNKDDYPDHLVAFVGICCSFGARWFKGYARAIKGIDNPNTYPLRAINAFKREVPLIKDIVFSCDNYNEMIIPNNSIIYCDPPYANCKTYKLFDFDHDAFWQWARNMSKKGHTVYVSEYTAPDDIDCVWSMDRHISISHNIPDSNLKETEKLYKL